MTVRAPIFLENDTTNQTSNILRLFVKDLFGDRGGIINTDDLAVVQRAAGANMSVDVGPGSTINPGTEGSTPGSYVVTNDATINVTITASNPTNPRNDLIITKVRDAFYSGANNDAQIIAVAGTPAGSPVDPDLDALGHENYVKLARVVVAANATSITNANIADLRERTVATGGVVAQATNPGATLGANGIWLNTNSTKRSLLVRNAANTAWEVFMTGGPGISYTPTLYNHSVGAGGFNYARYRRFGRTIIADGYVKFAGPGSITGRIGVSLPFAAANLSGSYSNEFFFHGAARAYDASADDTWAAVGVVGVGTVTNQPDRLDFFATGGTVGWNATIPFTWNGSDSDYYSWFCEYEAATSEDTNFV